MIRPRGTMWQVDFSFNGQRYRKDLPTREAAREWEIEMRSLLMSGKSVQPNTRDGSPRYLKDAIDQVYDRVWSTQKDSETALSNAQKVLNLMGNVELKHITPDKIDALVATMRKNGYAPATVNRKLAALSKVLHFAHKRQWIAGVPVIERMKEPQGRVRWFTQEEEQAVLDWFLRTGYEEMADVVTFLIDSGLRLGELCRLRWADVSNGLTIVRDSKSGKPRSVPQTGRVKVIVARRRAESPQDQEHVFTLSKRMIQQRWEQCRLALGKDQDQQWLLHTLRHTFISRLVQNQVNLRHVQELAGHSTLLVTQRYAHLSPANLVSAVATLDKHPDPSSGRHEPVTA